MQGKLQSTVTCVHCKETQAYAILIAIMHASAVHMSHDEQPLNQSSINLDHVVTSSRTIRGAESGSRIGSKLITGS